MTYKSIMTREEIENILTRQNNRDKDCNEKLKEMLPGMDWTGWSEKEISKQRVKHIEILAMQHKYDSDQEGRKLLEKEIADLLGIVPESWNTVDSTPA